jgi:hypothetical protein
MTPPSMYVHTAATRSTDLHLRCRTSCCASRITYWLRYGDLLTMAMNMISPTRTAAVYSYWTTSFSSTSTYGSTTPPMTFGANKTRSAPVPIPTSCCCHKKTSAHIRTGTLVPVSSSMSWYNTAMTPHLHIPSQTGWTSCSSIGSDVTQTPRLDGTLSDYLGFSSSTKKTSLTPSVL